MKRRKILDYFKLKNVDLAFLQETHFKTADVNRFQNKFYKVISFSCAPNKSKGGLILAKKKLKYNFGVGGSKGKGRFCYISASINGLQVCLSAIYAPNVFTSSFSDDVKSKLLEFVDYRLILGCDLNLVVDPIIDTSNLNPSQRQPSSRFIKSFLEDLNVVVTTAALRVICISYSAYMNKERKCRCLP